jgi:hypothetical protein
MSQRGRVWTDHVKEAVVGAVLSESLVHSCCTGTYPPFGVCVISKVVVQSRYDCHQMTVRRRYEK